MSVPANGNGRPHKGSRLVNGDLRFVTNEAAEEFILEIHRARQSGLGFVPFIGAGFSAAAGAPILVEIGAYLERCIAMGLGIDLDEKESQDMEPWNPRTDQWPPWIDARRMRKAGYWSTKVHDAVQQYKDDDEERAVVLQGAGATAEWRAALTFLSRLDRKRREPGANVPNPARLVDPDSEIIDSCFREVLKGRHPSLCHRLLGVLAGVLRLDLVLTTNFDDLLERGFAVARNRLEPFDVRLSGNLPPLSALADVRPIIKLHGSRHSLRADYSLDAQPSESDKMRFIEYLVTRESRSRLKEWKGGLRPDQLKLQNNLLIMGSKAEDGRTRALIEHAWRSLPDQFRVFWLCYSKRDVESIQAFTGDFHGSQSKDKNWEGSIILRHSDFGLFLLQLYQMERKNLPPLGALFPSVSRLTVPPLQSADDQNAGGKFCEAVEQRIQSFRQQKWHGPRLIIATEEGKARGVTSACAKVFRNLEAGNICLWIDMNDISSADNLFEVLLEAAYFRLGLEHWTPVYMAEDQSRRRKDKSSSSTSGKQPEHRSRTAEIKRLVDSVNKEWVIFLNARETPGVNTAREEDDAGNPHLWLDVSRDQSSSDNLSSDESGCVEDFVDLVFELCAVDKVSVVLLCRGQGGITGRPGLLGHLGQKDPFLAPIKLKADSGDAISFSEDEVIRKAIVWTDNDPERRRFLQALVLMQRQRLPSTIWNRAVSIGDHGKEKEWVNELEKTGLVRRKAGGFIWIHVRSRQGLRKKLSEDSARQDAAVGGFFEDWHPQEDAAEIHGALAEWYMKVLDVSEAPAALFEVVYHFCKAAESYVQRNREGDGVLACESLGAASALLKRSSFLVQTHGYSRGSCRRLEHIRDSLCDCDKTLNGSNEPALKASIQRLRIVCTEVMRAIAREVGEDAKAFLRHRQFAMLITTGDWGLKLKQQCDTWDGDWRFARALHESLKAEDGLKYVRNPQAEWLRWWRWSAMLGIASRSFNAAQQDLEKALRYVSEKTSEYDLPSGGFEIGRLNIRDLALVGIPKSGSRPQGLRIEVLRLLVQYAEVLLLRDSAKRRLVGIAWREASSQDAADQREDACTALRKIEECVETGRKLAAFIRADDHSDDARDTARANWCESRLLMHASVCAARRVQLDFDAKDRQRQNAMALLGDAEASLRVSDPGRQRLELAMIELHRVEARLREAEAVPIPVNGDVTLPFASFCRRLSEVQGIWHQKTVEEVEQIVLPPKNEAAKRELQRASSLVADAIRFLNRAEPVLRERRRNVWWTTWFFERRLRSIALSVWASVFEQGAPIPYLGLEAAMRDTPTVADTLLDNACRMIRVDAYRLATIIDAYASCNKALQLRLTLDDTTVGLPRRQDAMRARLEASLTDLEQVQDLREDQNRSDWWATMDDDVRKYVQRVKKESRRIHGELRNFRK